LQSTHKAETALVCQWCNNKSRRCTKVFITIHMCCAGHSCNTVVNIFIPIISQLFQPLKACAITLTAHNKIINTAERYSFSVHTMQAYRGCSSIAPLILIISTSWRRVVIFMTQLLYSWERALIRIEQKSRWAPKLVCRLWKWEMLIHPSGIRNPDCPVCSSVTIPTKLPWLPL